MTRTPSDAPAGGLSLLVETEDRLEAMIAARREEATGLVAEARRHAAGRLAELEVALAREAERLRVAVLERAREEATAATAAAERRARRFRQIPQTRIDALARRVVDRVVSPTEGVP